ncbi:MAG TPA: hypothetical protein P5136_00445 [Methanofastidiosum sp.]|nr:hypothetical protein [Methanofastidiosum sp.]
MKKLIGSDFGSYTFNPATRQITLTTGFSTYLKLEQILLITNVTANTIIYSFADPNLGGSITNDVITLVYDTVAMNASDSLQIFIDIIDDVQSAPDYTQTFTYLDAGTVNERINTIVHSSAILGKSMTETFIYAGTAPNYRVVTIILS